MAAWVSNPNYCGDCPRVVGSDGTTGRSYCCRGSGEIIVFDNTRYRTGDNTPWFPPVKPSAPTNRHERRKADRIEPAHSPDAPWLKERGR